MLIDLHSHTTLSDGTRSMEEMVSAAERRGYRLFAITDHARAGDPAYLDLVASVRDQVDRLQPETSVRLLPGTEVTDFAPEQIAEVVAKVRRAGAQIVVIHGECLVLDVAPGTNAAAVRVPGVDILAHPGLLSDEEALLAARNGVYVELSARHGADYANGHVYRVARRHGARIMVDSDAHDEANLLSANRVEAVVRGAGAPPQFLEHLRTIEMPSLAERLIQRSLHAAV